MQIVFQMQFSETYLHLDTQTEDSNSRFLLTGVEYVRQNKRILKAKRFLL